MNPAAKKTLYVYLALTLSSTFAASFIWGINTLFLLDAGLSSYQAFAANAFFSVGMLLFELPTGIIADTWGRRSSFLMGTITLILSTLLYLLLWDIKGSFVLWALSSILIGLGFTFFSGAVEAWIVDAMNHEGYEGPMETVFAKGQTVAGFAMLSGSVIGGISAEHFNLGFPFILRIGMLILTFLIAYFAMHDLGFKSRKIEGLSHALDEMKQIASSSLQFASKQKAARWMILSGFLALGLEFMRSMRCSLIYWKSTMIPRLIPLQV